MYGGPIGALPIAGGKVVGIVQLPAQPKFSVGVTTPQSNITGDGVTATLIFDNVVSNIQSGYSAITGIFTVPVSGFYHFSSCVALSGITAAHNGAKAYFLVNSTQYVIYRLDAGITRYNGDNTFASSGNIDIDLIAGDTVKVQILVLGDGQVVGTTTEATFSGYMTG